MYTFLKKKGEQHELMFFIFMLVVLGVVVLAIFRFQERAVNSSQLDQAFLQRDLSMFMTIASAAPNVLRAEYTFDGVNNPLRSFDVHLRPGELVVDQSIPYASAKNHDFSHYFTKPEKIELTFANNVERGKTSAVKVPDVDTSSEYWLSKKFYFESNVNDPNLADVMFNELKNKKDAVYDIYVRVKIGDRDRLYIAPNLKSRKLASLISNASVHVSSDPKLSAAREAGVVVESTSAPLIYQKLEEYHE